MFPLDVTRPMARASRPHFAQIVEHRYDLVGLDHRQHPFLRFGDHDLERLHIRLTKVHVLEIDIHPGVGLGGHLRGWTREAPRS